MEFVIKTAEFITGAVNARGYPEPGPPEIAFAGRSNVGKSSLINKITNRKKLVKVSNRPGRTQQINFFSINDDQLRLVDLPGYGFAKVPLAVKKTWRVMIEEYLLNRETLAVVVVILDIRRTPNEEDLMLLDWLNAGGVNTTVAITKSDKLSNNKINARLAKLRPVLIPYDLDPVVFSAKTGRGVDKIWQRLYS